MAAPAPEPSSPPPASHASAPPSRPGDADPVPAEGNFGTLIESTVRVVSWNIWWRFGPWEARLPAIIETLRRLDADIVCLQEVWIEAETGASSAALIADALGFDPAHVVLANRVDLDGVGFGNAVISRFPIAGHEMRPLWSPEELEEFRTVVRADIDGPRGPIQVFTTHLHWRFDHSHIRQQQVREICRFVRESPDRSYPAILCGDFNADPLADEIRMLTGRAAVPEPPLAFFDAWETAADRTAAATPRASAGDTWSNDNPYAVLDLEPSRRIDFLFTGFPKAGGAGQAVHVELVGVDAVDGVVPSDHYGVLGDLRY